MTCRFGGEELGFSQVGVSSIDLTHAEPGLTEWLEKGFHGEMEYMSRHGLTRARPAELIRGTLSVITARMNYLPSDTSTRDLIWIQQERDRLAKVDEGVISEVLNEEFKTVDEKKEIVAGVLARTLPHLHLKCRPYTHIKKQAVGG